ncbi:hypothetical protein chiPu_0028411 [Chiloscyllium punctatum]|uniref:Uncharacterized protein n=1 Tax=Chiloscyllium punctatum TaxID=137246 RepID=A0A401TPX6_CHIPU|nr:hypothetical protein [Chiloscyllium punctatum]
MDVLVDVIDPANGNKMMVNAVGRTLFGQLDLVGAFKMVDFADCLFVGRDDVHVLFDLRGICHGKLLWYRN